MGIGIHAPEIWGQPHVCVGMADGAAAGKQLLSLGNRFCRGSIINGGSGIGPKSLTRSGTGISPPPSLREMIRPWLPYLITALVGWGKPAAASPTGKKKQHIVHH